MQPTHTHAETRAHTHTQAHTHTHTLKHICPLPRHIDTYMTTHPQRHFPLKHTHYRFVKRQHLHFGMNDSSSVACRKHVTMVTRPLSCSSIWNESIHQSKRDLKQYLFRISWFCPELFPVLKNLERWDRKQDPNQKNRLTADTLRSNPLQSNPAAAWLQGISLRREAWGGRRGLGGTRGAGGGDQRPEWPTHTHPSTATLTQRPGGMYLCRSSTSSLKVEFSKHRSELLMWIFTSRSILQLI